MSVNSTDKPRQSVEKQPP